MMRIATMLAFAALTSLALSACDKSQKTPTVGPASAADSADQIMENVHITLFVKGLRRAEVFADTAYTFEEQTRFDFRKARATFNKESGAPDGTMTANRAIYSTRTQVLEGFGNVVVTSTDGKKLTSPHVTFSQSSNEISSDTSFTVTQGDKSQSGIGFTTDPNLSRWTCKSHCVGSGLVNLSTTP
jgi:LPS export ABC transporter protein LptC